MKNFFSSLVKIQRSQDRTIATQFSLKRHIRLAYFYRGKPVAYDTPLRLR